MIRLKGEKIGLRALEPEDLDLLFQIENNPDNWKVSGTQMPFSRMLLRRYLDAAHQDIYESKQLRLVIYLLESGKALGLIDLFDFDPYNLRAGVGIIIAESQFRQCGYASEALELLVGYGFNALGLHQIYAGVGVTNKPSLSLFHKIGFLEIGVRRDWIKTVSGFEDEIMFQKINENVS